VRIGWGEGARFLYKEGNEGKKEKRRGKRTGCPPDESATGHPAREKGAEIEEGWIQVGANAGLS
jgi:hypothetical protein